MDLTCSTDGGIRSTNPVQTSTLLQYTLPGCYTITVYITGLTVDVVDGTHGRTPMLYLHVPSEKKYKAFDDG
jgi:hypothetical protein